MAGWLSSAPGVVEHGLFPPELVAIVLIGHGESVEARKVNGLDGR